MNFEFCIHVWSLQSKASKWLWVIHGHFMNQRIQRTQLLEEALTSHWGIISERQFLQNISNFKWISCGVLLYMVPLHKGEAPAVLPFDVHHPCSYSCLHQPASPSIHGSRPRKMPDSLTSRTKLCRMFLCDTYRLVTEWSERVRPRERWLSH